MQCLQWIPSSVVTCTTCVFGLKMLFGFDKAGLMWLFDFARRDWGCVNAVWKVVYGFEKLKQKSKNKPWWTTENYHQTLLPELYNPHNFILSFICFGFTVLVHSLISPIFIQCKDADKLILYFLPSAKCQTELVAGQWGKICVFLRLARQVFLPDLVEIEAWSRLKTELKFVSCPETLETPNYCSCCCVWSVNVAG